MGLGARLGRLQRNVCRQLELIYNGQPVAVDAFYGWYREIEYRPDGGGGGGSASVSATCVPTIIKTGEDQVHNDLNAGDNGYSVTVVNYATVRVVGCGESRTYTVTTCVRTITVDGTTYQVTDPKRRCPRIRPSRKRQRRYSPL